MFVGIDIGGSNSRVALFCQNFPKIVRKIVFANLGKFADDSAKLLAAISEISMGREVEKIGVSIAGELNRAKSALVVSPNLPNFVGRPIRKLLAQKFCCPVMLENDAVAAARAEAIFGTNREKNFLFVIWGSGVGGALVEFRGGKTWLENLELGHIPLDRRGDLESFCGGNSISKKYSKMPQNLSELEWAEIEKNFAEILQKVIVARKIPLVVFGGGIAYHQKIRVREVGKLISAKTRITKFGENAGLVGAATLFREKIKN